METQEKTVFQTLNDINVSNKVEKKNGLSYLSWAFAWGEVKKNYPNANYIIYERTTQEGYQVNYFTDGRTCWVKTGAIIKGLEHIEYLPIMDYRNKSIPLDSITSFDVNKAIQRSLTKAFARHGIGLYIYCGEDLPDEEKKAIEEKKKNAITPTQYKMLVDNQETAIDIIKLKQINVHSFKELTSKQASDIIKEIKAIQKKQNVKAIQKKLNEIEKEEKENE